jgi:hypothetical protein
MNVGTILLIVLGTLSLPAHAAIVLTAPVYTQDFNSLANSGTSNVLPQGWSISETGSSSRVDGNYTAGTGSSLTGDTYSFGAQDAADRALGSVATGTLLPSYGALFTNGLGGPISALAISYFGELWRVGSAGNINTLSFAYSLDATSLITGSYTNFTTLDFTANPTGSTGARDGNIGRTSIMGTITGLTLAQGDSILLRWSGANASGNDHGLAIDDFSLTANTNTIPEPASWAMLIAGFGLVGAAARNQRRRQRRRQLAL